MLTEAAGMEAETLDLTAPIEPRAAGCSIPLTPAQRRAWHNCADRNGRRLSLRLCASAIRILGTFSPSLFGQSIESAMRRHEALRTRVASLNGTPVLQADPVGAYVLNTTDLSGLSLPDAERETLRLAQEFMDEPIDLPTGALFEARAWKLRDDDHVLVLLIDHMVSDGISNGILTREIWSFYREAARRRSPVLPDLPIQFGDYAVWQARTHRSWMEKHAAYWREHLGGLGPTVIPSASGIGDVKVTAGSTIHIPFGDSLSAALRDAARREGTLTCFVVLAAYAVVISSWCRKTDLLIAFPFHGRHRPALQNMIGFVANVLYLRVLVQEAETLRDLLSRIKREVAAAFQHRDFDRVPDFVPGCVTDVIFNWQTTHSEQGALDHHVVLECAASLTRPQAGEELRILPLPARTPASLKFSPLVFDTPSGLHMAVAYRPDMLTSSCMAAFGRNLLVVARQLAECPSATIASAVATLNDQCADRGLPPSPAHIGSEP